MKHDAKVTVVTGANKGIGLEVVRQLCSRKRPDDVIILTARNPDLGTKAVEDLKNKGCEGVKFHQLDITNEDSIATLKKHIENVYGGLDVLVNNAGIAFNNDATDPFHVQAEKTVTTNFTGTLSVCTALFPLLRKGARVVNVSSSCGHLSKINGDEPAAQQLRDRLSSSTLTQEELKDLMNNFVESAKSGDHFKSGWPNNTYKVSKVGVSALTIIQQREMNATRPQDDIAINRVHPGYVDTDMTNHKGIWPVEQGAKSLVHAATLPPETSVKGEYIWEDCTVTSWTEAKVNLFY